MHDSTQRDFFLSYSSSDRKIIADVQRILSQRQITTFFDRVDLTPGHLWFDQLETALSSVRAVAVFIGRGGLGTVQKREMQLALCRQAQEEKSGRTFPVVPVLLDGADPELFSGFLALNTWVDLSSGIEVDHAMDRLVGVVRPLNIAGQDLMPAPLCPYFGLNAFREEDALLYFGRDAFSQKLADQVCQKNFVAVVGRSGSGKSSVVQAGLLPRLRSQRPPADTWESIMCTPGSKPFHRLAVQLVALWSRADRDQTDVAIEAEKLGDQLVKGELTLGTCTDLAIQKLRHSNRLVLIVDQFEELFTQTTQIEMRRLFVEQLLAASAESNLTVVITLRADFYGNAIGLGRQLSDCIANGIVNVTDMTREELKQAIQKPAAKTGISFEAGLIDRILDNIEQQPGGLPLLEYALTELWQRRNNLTLPHSAYDAIGGVAGAISKRAEAQFEKLTPSQKRIAMPTLARLVHLSTAPEESADTRQVIKLNEMDGEAKAVVRLFAARESRLVVLGRDETTGAENVQVAHEALIRNWLNLRDWINHDREFLLWRQQLQPFLQKWCGLTQNNSLALLQGVYLAEASRWLRERSDQLNELERTFIQASEKPVLRLRYRKRLFLASVLAVVMLALVAADMQINFPLAPQLRWMIDTLDVSVARRPKTYAQFQALTDELIREKANDIRARVTPKGWIGNGPSSPFIDYYTHAQAACALLHSPKEDRDKALSQSALKLLFASAPREQWADKKYGFAPDNSGQTVVIHPILWAGSALAALASSGEASQDPWSASLFQESFHYVRDVSLNYHDNASSGWRQFANADSSSTYATVLATQMLIDIRDAGLQWGDRETLNNLIENNIGWLLRQYQRDKNGFWGWREGVSEVTVPGLTLQAYSVILRAATYSNRLVPNSMIETITHVLENGFDDEEQWKDLTTWPRAHFVDPRTQQILYSNRTTTFPWYPPAIECVARWMRLNAGKEKALQNHLIRRTLTQLLVRGDQRIAIVDSTPTFRSAEILYALGSLHSALIAAKEK
jgi:Novel STAND NTPase 1/TIR domain